MTSAKLKVAVLYDVWEDEAVATEAVEEKAPPRKSKSKRKTRIEKEDREEIHEAEAMMRREGIRWLSTTTKSIEEISTTILQEIRPERLEY